MSTPPNRNSTHYPTYLPYTEHTDVSDSSIPESFSWQDQIQLCPVGNQGSCGDCWAFSTAGMLTDRLTVATGKYQGAIAVQSISGCAFAAVRDRLSSMTNTTISSKVGTCSTGGFIAAGCIFAENYGVPLDTCVPYKNGDSCPTTSKCTPLYSFTKGSTTTVTTGPDGAAESLLLDIEYKPGALSQDTIDANVRNMQKEIMKNGPLAIGYMCMQSMMGSAWKDQTSEEDVYQVSDNDTVDGGHAVVIVGWGVTPTNKTPYWLIRNSWGSTWNSPLNGYWRHLRGSNNSGIESSAIAAQASAAPVTQAYTGGSLPSNSNTTWPTWKIALLVSAIILVLLIVAFVFRLVL